MRRFSLLLASALGLAACTSAPPAASPASSPGQASSVADTIALPDTIYRIEDVTNKPRLANRGQIERLLAETVPPAMEEIGRTRAQGKFGLVIGRSGVVRNASVVESTGSPGLDQLGRRVILEMRFRPARVRGAPVTVALEMPLSFWMER